MGGVAPGSPVSASNTNAAFLDANGDDTAIGRITLSNTLAESGAQVDNIQREHNAQSSYTGMPLNSAKDVLPAWTDNQVGTNSDTLKARAEALTGTMDPTTGHTHDGTAGNGPQITSPNIADVPLQGVYIQGTDITGVSGGSSDVSSQLTGQTPSLNSVTKGVVVVPPYNLIFVRQATGVSANDVFTDGSGNVVYGRLTESSGVWTLSFYVNLSGTETPYSFGSSVDVRWYYQKLFDRIVDAPVYSDLSNIPSDNATADVVDASETVAGKVMLANAAPPAVASASVKGSSTRSAKSDHTHEGIHSLGKYGDATKLLGDVDLEEGTGIALTRTGQRIKIDSTGGTIGYQEVPSGIVNGTNDTFGPLTNTPASNESIMVFVDGVLRPKTHYSVSGGNTIVFGGSYIPQLGQSVYVVYLSGGTPATPPVLTGTQRTEFRTVTAGEAAAKKLILAYTPADPAGLVALSETPLFYNDDYTVVANEFRWNGYALDGVLASGDKLIIQYLT